MPKLNWNGDDFRNSRDSSGTVADNISRDGNLQQGYNHGSLTRGLVAYYPMEKGEGEVLHDGAMDNLGQINGASWNGTGQVGEEDLNFDGDSDYIELREKDYGKIHTISAWGALTSDQIVILSGPTTNNGDNYAIYYNNSTIYYKADGEYVSASVSDLRNTGYHNFTIKREQSEVKFYLDGKLINTANLTNNRNLTLSAIGYGTYDNGYYWNGRIEDVRIYNRALSQPEIEALTNLSQPSGIERTEKDIPGLDQGGVSRYKLNGDVSDSWGDNSGMDSTSVSPGYLTGVYGKAKNFDGDDDYLDVPLGVFSSDSFWSCSLWFNSRDISKHVHFTGVSNDHPDGWTPLSHFGIRNSQLTWWDHNGWRYGGTNLSSGKWYHTAIVGGNGVIKIYLNGSVDGVETANIQNNIGYVENIGRRQHKDDRYFDGKIDDVRIYNKALTPLQVEKLYHKGAYRIPRKSTLQ